MRRDESQSARISDGDWRGNGHNRPRTKAASAVNAGKIKYIDIHTHLGAFYHGRELTAELLVKFMDQHDVEKACVLPLISPESAPLTQPVTTALAAHKAFPNRIIPFCALDPRAVTEPGQRAGHVVGVKGILKRYHEAGCRGLGEHKTGLPFDAPQQMIFYEACDTGTGGARPSPACFHHAHGRRRRTGWTDHRPDRRSRLSSSRAADP